MKHTKAITKWLLGAVMAGAFLLATPHQAQAQVVVAAGPYAPVYYGPVRYDGWRRREYFNHQRWEAERFHHERWARERFYGHRFDYRR